MALLPPALCVLCVMCAVSRGSRFEPEPVLQLLVGGLGPGTGDSEFVPPPDPHPAPQNPPVLPPPYLLLPMFRHQAAPFSSKVLFRPLTGSTTLPTSLENILIPRELQAQSRVLPVSNPRGVEVWCGYNKVSVRVNHTQLGFRLALPWFRLGTCPVSRSDSTFLYFHSELNRCGGALSVINGQLVYSNSLLYRPEVDETDPVMRAVPLTLHIQCVYDRFHYSYKVGYVPEPLQQTFRKKLEVRRLFRLSLRNERWEELNRDEGYMIGEPVNFEAAVDFITYGESIFIDACHVTTSEDSNSVPRHDVITNFGCMVESKNSGSQAHFVLRQMNILRFSLDAFLFSQSAAKKNFYLHCTLSVSKSAASSTAKSCTFSKSQSRWEELDGQSHICSCCESQCDGAGKYISAEAEKDVVSSEAWSLRLNDVSSQADRWMDTMPGQVVLQNLSGTQRKKDVVWDSVEEEVVLAGEEVLNTEEVFGCEEDDLFECGLDCGQDEQGFGPTVDCKGHSMLKDQQGEDHRVNAVKKEVQKEVTVTDNVQVPETKMDSVKEVWPEEKMEKEEEVLQLKVEEEWTTDIKRQEEQENMALMVQDGKEKHGKEVPVPKQDEEDLRFMMMNQTEEEEEEETELQMMDLPQQNHGSDSLEGSSEGTWDLTARGNLSAPAAGVEHHDGAIPTTMRSADRPTLRDPAAPE